MAKKKIPYGYYRDPKTGRLRKKKAATVQKRKRRKKKTGGSVVSMVGKAAKYGVKYGPRVAKGMKQFGKIVGPIIAGEVLKSLMEGKKKRGSGLKLMGQR